MLLSLLLALLHGTRAQEQESWRWTPDDSGTARYTPGGAPNAVGTTGVDEGAARQAFEKLRTRRKMVAGLVILAAASALTSIWLAWRQDRLEDEPTWRMAAAARLRLKRLISGAAAQLQSWASASRADAAPPDSKKDARGKKYTRGKSNRVVAVDASSSIEAMALPDRRTTPEDEVEPIAEIAEIAAASGGKACSSAGGPKAQEAKQSSSSSGRLETGPFALSRPKRSHAPSMAPACGAAASKLERLAGSGRKLAKLPGLKARRYQPLGAAAPEAEDDEQCRPDSSGQGSAQGGAQGSASGSVSQRDNRRRPSDAGAHGVACAAGAAAGVPASRHGHGPCVGGVSWEREVFIDADEEYL